MPTATSIVAAPAQYATPVNQVWETVSAPATYTAAPTVISGATYSSPVTTLAAQNYTTMAAPTVTTLAAQNYTTMAAVPTTMTTVAAPMMRETLAPTSVTMAMPQTQTIQYAGSVSAPIMSPAPIMGTRSIVAQPQTTTLVTQAASYVAPQTLVQAPVQTLAASYVAPQVLAQPTMAVPQSLTQGIPNPDQIRVQKDAYGAALEKQLSVGIDTIKKETEIEKNMIKFNADKQLALMQLQVEERRNEQMALLDEQATFRQCELKKAYVDRKLQLDNQANGFVMDYQMKAVQTELAAKQYEFQQNYVKSENVLAAQYNKEVARANTGTTYAVPANVAA